ncbi:hypothetical protein LSAT2_013192 [Lamellibrachia satsuma]|nr:hypothetical protein LSAT2_013192 [Lamellibrachia satsuma]
MTPIKRLVEVHALVPFREPTSSGKHDTIPAAIKLNSIRAAPSGRQLATTYVYTAKLRRQLRTSRTQQPYLGTHTPQYVEDNNGGRDI